MTYEEFKQMIKDKERVPDYYEQLLHHHNHVLLDISLLGQKKAAEQLGLTQGKLSILKSALVAYYNIQQEA